MAHSIVRTHSFIDSSKDWRPGVISHEIELAEGERERWMGKGGGHSIVQTHSYIVG